MASKRNGRRNTKTKVTGSRRLVSNNSGQGDAADTQAEEVLRKVSDELEQQLRNFRAVVSSVSDFIYSFDLSGDSPSSIGLCSICGRKLSTRRSAKIFMTLDYPRALAAKLQRQIQQVIRTRRLVKDETPFTSAFGERQYEYIFVPVLSLGGEVEAVAGVTRDITERKAREAELRSLRLESEHALERRVKKRTAELLAANRKLESETPSAETGGRVTRSGDREQRRLGQDLHDSLCQHLAATAFMTRALAERMRTRKQSSLRKSKRLPDLSTRE